MDTCAYCGEPVDEETQSVFYTTLHSADHLACVPASEKEA